MPCWKTALIVMIPSLEDMYLTMYKCNIIFLVETKQHSFTNFWEIMWIHLGRCEHFDMEWPATQPAYNGEFISLMIADQNRVILRSAKTKQTFGYQIHVSAQPVDNACCIRLSTRLRLNCARGRIHPLNLDFCSDKLFQISFWSWHSNKKFQEAFRLFMLIWWILSWFSSCYFRLRHVRSHVSTAQAGSVEKREKKKP